MAVDRRFSNDFVEFLDRFFEQHFLPGVAEKYPNSCPLLLDGLREVKRKGVQSYFSGGLNPANGAPSLALTEQLNGADGSPSILFDLELTHDCAATGCGETSCLLCERNPSRKCGNEFMSDKYIEHGGLLSTCGQPMKIVLKEKRTGEIVPQDMELIVSLLKGHEFDPNSNNEVSHCGKDFRPYIDMFKLDGLPLLDSKSTTSQHKQDDGIRFRMQGGVATFPVDLTTTTSSSSHHGCKNGSFRLLVRVCPETRGFPFPHQIKAFVSKSFATVTSRARPLLKAKIPFLTDDVEKLDRMGKERAKKFESLCQHVRADGLIKSVSTVAQFQECARFVNQHGPVRKEIIHAMKLSDVDWNRMVGHAAKAVEYDNRMRYFRPRERAGTIQLIIYKSNCAVIDFATGPVALVQDKKFVLKKDWAWQYDAMGELHRMAMEAWAQPGHPDWGILHFDSEAFEKDPSNLPTFDEADSLSADFMQVSLESTDPIDLTEAADSPPGPSPISPYQHPALHQQITASLRPDQNPQGSSSDQKKPSMIQLLRGIPVRPIKSDFNILPSPRTPPAPTLAVHPASTPPANRFSDGPMSHIGTPIDMPSLPQPPDPPLAMKPPPSPFTYQEAIKRNITSRPGSPKSGPSVGSVQCSTPSGSPPPGMEASLQNGEHPQIHIRNTPVHMHVRDHLGFMHANPQPNGDGHRESDFRHASHAHAHANVHAHLNSELDPGSDGLRPGFRGGSGGLCGVRPAGFEVDTGAMSMSDPLIKHLMAWDDEKLNDTMMGTDGMDGWGQDAEFSFPEQYENEALAILEGIGDIPLR
ncbi:hypothetical protein BSKO_09497 [Bryopsis sp. KO-2023]|nr:hypothetical protein BSKO_09497 [Bryopsis sp. KO-2023]